MMNVRRSVLGLLLILIFIFWGWLAFPSLRQAYISWQFNDEIVAYAFGGQRDPEGVLQPLRILFFHNPDVARYELYACRAAALGGNCAWPDDFEFSPMSSELLAPERVFLFATGDFSSEAMYRVVGYRADNSSMLSPIMKSKAQNSPTEFRPAWLTREMREGREEGSFVPFLTWNMPADAPNQLFLLRRKDGEVMAAFLPTEDHWFVGSRAGIRYSFFPVREFLERAPSLASDSEMEAVVFFADREHFVRFIAKQPLQ